MKHIRYAFTLPSWHYFVLLHWHPQAIFAEFLSPKEAQKMGYKGTRQDFI